MANPRQLALDLLNRVDQTDSYINLLLPKMLARIEITDADRGLVQELSYGSLRWRKQYDAFIDQFTTGKVLSAQLRMALQLGMHQLFRMRIPPHAAIHETVELVKNFETKAAGLANAVLRNADRAGFDKLLADSIRSKTELERLSIVFSHPEWVVSALRSALELDGKAEQLEDLLAVNNQTPIVNLAALPNTAAAEYLTSLGLVPGDASPIGFMAEGNPEPLLATPGVRVQDEGSQLVALVLLEVGDKSGQWLDMCSGPGGKSAVLQAGLSQSGGILECFEPSTHRAQLVRNALNPALQGKVTIASGQDAKSEKYDAVLLDAPCSGLGSVRRKPESRWRKQPEQLAALVKLQAELLEAAVRSLKPGGVLVYSTCSPLITETNTQIKNVLDKHPEISLENCNEVLNSLNPKLQMSTKRKTSQLWTHLHGTDAMFMAILRKG